MPSGGGDRRHLHCVGREFNSISVYGNYLILQKSDRLMIIVSDLSSHREIETHLDILQPQSPKRQAGTCNHSHCVPTPLIVAV